MCVGSLDQLDNCKSFRVFSIFKSMFKNSCIFLDMLGNHFLSCGNSLVFILPTTYELLGFHIAVT